MVTYPRLRSSIVNGDKCLEFVSLDNDMPVSLSLNAIFGASSGATTAGPRRVYGVLHTYCGHMPTKHSYEELVDLICPNVDDEY